jgi:tellurite resistance protein TehA-like permease
MFLTGAFLLVIPTLLTDNGKYLTPESITFAASLLIIAMNVAGFAAGPFVSLVETLSGGNVPIAGLYFGIFGEAAVVVVFFFIRLLQKDKLPTAAAAAA